jgi:hypothetical protein
MRPETKKFMEAVKRLFKGAGKKRIRGVRGTR